MMAVASGHSRNFGVWRGSLVVRWSQLERGVCLLVLEIVIVGRHGAAVSAATWDHGTVQDGVVHEVVHTTEKMVRPTRTSYMQHSASHGRRSSIPPTSVIVSISHVCPTASEHRSIGKILVLGSRITGPTKTSLIGKSQRLFG